MSNSNSVQRSIAAIRENGCCRGSLWKQQVQGVSQSPKREASDENRKTFEYCIVCCVLFISYADYNSYRRGDHPINVLKIVGASAFTTTKTGSEALSTHSTFRMVTHQGTHIYCTAPTPMDCRIWLSALHSGLEMSYSMPSSDKPVLKPPAKVKSPKTKRLFRDKMLLCMSCGRAADIITLATPLPQYGYETRCHVCPECLVSQGVWLDTHFRNQIYTAYLVENDAFRKGRDTCLALIEDTFTDIPLDEGSMIVSKANALRDMISNPTFYSHRRLSQRLDNFCREFEFGELDAVEFVELLQDSPDVKIAELKKEAVRVAGDMGSALKLLSEYSLAGDIEMFKNILDFFLDLCDEGDLASVAFFWPQLQSLHLRMLPPMDINQLIRVEIIEDFLLTVALRYSVHLSLDMIWGYVADLEDSLFHSNSPPSTRRRRFSVLRFVCELESLLFDFKGGWGGGSVSLRNILTPSPHQVTMLSDAIEQLMVYRRCISHKFFARSIRMEKLLQVRLSKPPDEAAEDALRVAKHADYFSSHLSFTRRICDVAEKLRFIEVDEREAKLKEELSTLNSSGLMGGDPLNRVTKDNLMRVVRVPPTEGHVFRSKERTPILLLMEVVRETDAIIPEVKDIDQKLMEQLDRYPRHEGPTEADSASRRASHYVIDLEMPSDLDSESNEAHNKSGTIVYDENGKSSKNSDLNDPNPSSDDSSMFQSKREDRKEIKGLNKFGEETESVREAHVSPRGALARFKRFDDDNHNVNFVTNDDPRTPTKQAMEQLVSDVIIQHLDIPRLPLDEDQRECRGAIPNAQAVNGLSQSSSRTNLTLSMRKISTLGDTELTSSSNSEDIKRNVLTTIMTKGLNGNHAIAAGAAICAQKSLQELERKKAVEMILSNEDLSEKEKGYNPPETEKDELTSYYTQKLIDLCLLDRQSNSDEQCFFSEEEEEAIESLRLLLIQNQKSLGSDVSYASLRSVNAPNHRTGIMDKSEVIEIHAGDVDSRLEGCGVLPPAVLSALTLWKGGIVTSAELLELVKKDLQYMQQSDISSDSRPDNSAFWGRFAFGERWAEKKARIAASSPEGSIPGWDLQGVIVKSNDDLRQEAFVMQLIELCREAFELAGLDLWVHPYRILATGRTTGIIECVKNAMSFDALKKRRGYKDGLRGHLKRMAEFSQNPGEAFKTMQLNFVRSLASYSLMTYLFLVKDRHNGNILLDTAGHVIHIDFGFVFGIAPGGSFSLEMSTPFKLTEEMLDVMGGMQSPLFSEFVTQFCCGFVALRAHMDTFLTLVEITCNTSAFKCFEGREPCDVVEKMRGRFCPDLSKEGAIAFAMDIIKQSTQSYGTKQYDFFQYLSQGIAA
jgi:phosphatidylinositol 4-kinase B